MTDTGSPSTSDDSVIRSNPAMTLVGSGVKPRNRNRSARPRSSRNVCSSASSGPCPRLTKRTRGSLRVTRTAASSNTG